MEYINGVSNVTEADDKQSQAPAHNIVIRSVHISPRQLWMKR